jgi:Ca2+-binding RTX toxin-like protein
MADPTTISTSGINAIDALLCVDEDDPSLAFKWDTNSITFSFPSSGWYYVEDQFFDIATVDQLAEFTFLTLTLGVEAALIEIGVSTLVVAAVALNGFEEFNDAQKASARFAMQQYQAVSGLQLSEGDEGFFDHETIRFAETGTTSAPAFGIPPLSSVSFLIGEGVLGDTWYTNDGTFDSPLPGSFADWTILHEAGHALGLKHSHESGLFGGRIPEVLEEFLTDVDGPELDDAIDTLEFTVMTYNGAPEQFGHPQTLMMLDIQAIQYLYGANFNTYSGNTTYSWDPTSGQGFIDGIGQRMPGANRVFQTIWDGNGIDTYDLSNYATAVNVNLAPGQWSITAENQRATIASGVLARGTVFNALLYNNDLRSIIENATGGAGNDTLAGNQVGNELKGNGGNDTATGLAGADTLVGDAGNDTLDGGDDADSISGGADNDSLSGGGANDTVDGGSGSDTILGGDGDDSLLGGSEGDSISGGSGNDTVRAGSGNDTVTGEAGANDIAGEDGADWLTGGDEADTITGGVGNDTLLGLGGADLLHGDGDNDSIEGGDDNDTITGDGGDDRVTGGNGADSLSGDDGSDIVFGEAGSDHITGGADGDQLFGGTEDDIIDAGLGNNFVYGGTGSDSLTAGDGDDLIDGSSGDDTIGAGGGSNLVFGGSGLDAITTGDGNDAIDGGADSDTIGAGGGNDTVDGDAGADSIDAGDGDDSVIGGDGNDTVLGGLGADTIEAGGGDDSVDAGGGDDSVSGGDGADTLVGGDGLDTLSGDAEDDVLYGGADADTLFGGDGNDDLYGGAASDFLSGDAGNDTLDGGADPDTLDGGEGIDMASYLSATGPVVINLQDPTQTTGDASGDLLISIEQFGLTNFDDLFIGRDDPLVGDWVFGRGGNDTLLGFDGNDTLWGEAGDDSIVGGKGADEMNGGDGFDTTSYEESGTGIVVDLVDPARNTGIAAGDQITSIEGFRMTNWNDEFVGLVASELVLGFDGNDTLTGNGGNDTLDGGTQQDILRGGDGNDSLIGAAGLDLIFGGNDDDILTGNADQDTLYGGAGNDLIYGGGQNDRLFGETGNDTFYGGLGDKDNFVFAASDWGDDQIMDFQDRKDIIEIVGLGVPNGRPAFENLIKVTQQVGYALIEFKSGIPGSIQVWGVNAADLTHQDFLFN